jgi:hypothetical protein
MLETSGIAPGQQLADAGGQPAVLLVSGDLSRDLFYHRSSDAGGMAWDAGQILQHHDFSLAFPMLLNVSNRPAAFWRYNNTVGDMSLQYRYANDAEGTSWGPVVDVVPNSGALPMACAEVAGAPAVAYWNLDDMGDGTLTYTCATSADGSSWSTPVEFGDAQPLALCVVGGRPAMASSDTATHAFQFRRAMDATGAAWGPPVDLGTCNDFGDMLVIAGQTVVAFPDSAGTAVMWRVMRDTEGTRWTSAESIATLPSAATGLTLGDVNGQPCVAFINQGGITFMSKY